MQKQKMNIVIAGHVDHGKSTVIGRLLADTQTLPEGKLESLKEMCERNSKPFEYAFLIDALKDEQAQGITIDAARVFFKTSKRDYIIIDAPGHIEFLKNMVTGASRAEAALLVIDAKEGVRENSRRHGYMLSMLGITQIAVLVNKMDLVDYDETVFKNIVAEYSEFLNEIKITPSAFIPVSGMDGDNIASLSDKTEWYKGDTVLEVLDNFKKEKALSDKPFRMPVQDVYKFTKFGDDRRIMVGTVETGSVSIGDTVIFYPSGKKSKIKSFESFNTSPIKNASAGYASGFTLDEQIYVTRGEVAVKKEEQRPEVTSRIRANIFWLGKKPMVKKKEYFLKTGTAKVSARIEKVVRVIDASNLQSSENKQQIERHDVAECILNLGKAIAFDTSENISQTSRFVIIDDYEICGGGIIRQGLSDKQSDARDQILLRNYKWDKSIISTVERAERYNQKSALIVITGEEDTGKKPLARKLEENLFREGKFVYFLGIGNVLYGVDADIRDSDERSEHIRRLAEIAHILLDTGMILIITAKSLTQEDLELIKMSVNPDDILSVWVGDKITTDLECDMHISGNDTTEESCNRIKGILQESGVIFKPW
jgi:bifunctional enzyme CysN/CysC